MVGVADHVVWLAYTPAAHLSCMCVCVCARIRTDTVLPGFQFNATRNITEPCPSDRFADESRLAAADTGCQPCALGSSTNALTGQATCGEGRDSVLILNRICTCTCMRVYFQHRWL
jgi:hypothetical protein